MYSSSRLPSSGPSSGVARTRVTASNSGTVPLRGRLASVSLSAMVLAVIALVLPLRVVLLALDAARLASRNLRGAAARGLSRNAGGHREQALRIGRAAFRAGRRLAEPHELLEFLAALAALEVVERHCERIL